MKDKNTYAATFTTVLAIVGGATIAGAGIVALVLALSI